MADKHSRWTEEDEHFLVKSRGTLTSAQIAAELGRAVGGVDAKIKQLKHIPRMVDEWTHEQDQFLMNMYIHFEVKILSEQLGRTVNAIKMRAIRLGLSGQPRSTQLQFIIWDTLRDGAWMTIRDVIDICDSRRDYTKQVCSKWSKSGHLETRRFVRTEGRGNPYVRQYRRPKNSAYFPPGTPKR